MKFNIYIKLQRISSVFRFYVLNDFTRISKQTCRFSFGQAPGFSSTKMGFFDVFTSHQSTSKPNPPIRMN
jgi:hypothetical protein